MRFSVFDIETDGLLDTVSTIHCLSYQIFEAGILIDKGTITDYNDMIDWVTSQHILVGHSIINYDIPVLEKLLEINIPATFIDTLALSWYLFPYRPRHGLEFWGNDVGVAKPEILDWKNLTQQEYIFRCESDVEINQRILFKFFDYLRQIYSNDLESIMRLNSYLGFKMDCIKEQSEAGLTLDRRLAEETKLNLEFTFDERISLLSDAMPAKLGKVLKTKPKVMYKKDETLSRHGTNWVTLLKDKNLPLDTEEIREKPNPGSNLQLKTWLFELGWTPETFKKNAKDKMIPQISLPFGQGICPSIKILYEEHPVLENLEGLFMIKHRLGLIKSYLENVKEGKVYSKAHGFTNTLRLQHSKPIVNLPGVKKEYGKEIRGCLTIPDSNHIMCGSDITALEDNTKQHYIYFFDKEYVEQMRTPGFCPHLDIGILGGSVTKEEADLYKFMDGRPVACPEKYLSWTQTERKAEFSRIKEIRGDDKVVNFSATYGAGPAKIAKTGKKPISWGKRMHTTYWKRNKAVKQTANACVIKAVKYIDYVVEETVIDVDGELTTKKVKTEVQRTQKWLYNPVSGFWMFLKADKDKFSTLNQSTGVYFFDMWVKKVREKLNPLGIKLSLQYHDEILFICLITQKEQVEFLLYEAMKETNAEVSLNVDIGMSVDWGDNYADCH